jgi:hypothetical protein
MDIPQVDLKNATPSNAETYAMDNGATEVPTFFETNAGVEKAVADATTNEKTAKENFMVIVV